jgi:AraC-like DNA-binding protein
MRADAPSADVIDIVTAGRLPFLINVSGGGPEATRLVCGYLACDSRPFNPLLENLPRAIKAGSAVDRKSGVFGQLVGIALAEAVDKREGGEGVLAKLSELMFIEVLREYLGALPPGQRGWLAGLRDPLVHKALSRMHARPAQAWTIEDLAREAGTSRSVLAERFTELIGIPPMQYLARWRMQVASELLSSGSTTIAGIAAEIGYESEAAFSRAFKKAMGIPPSKWRRPQRAGHDQPASPG